MAGEDLIELKFRLADGTDIGPSKYNPATTVQSLKEKIIAQWPKVLVLHLLFLDLKSISLLVMRINWNYWQKNCCVVDKENCPKTVNSVQLINAGKILENHKTISESRVPVGELPGGVITMHVVLRPTLPDKNSGKSSIC
ncbi:hypothetical protein JRO89_XS07G0153700 [Xanthoceras sorbifolium]|uniref:Membrane-anchored ubiquitin-fold protein n=1 Tax=Xanthoceras sorbifolium TaxID=99658 RepID=A0ABQ8HU00_9ROSI|nr:hypothetical protein JRO89_XS07G0153700 [Xanthoceras sorbifolium]